MVEIIAHLHTRVTTKYSLFFTQGLSRLPHQGGISVVSGVTMSEGKIYCVDDKQYMKYRQPLASD